MDKQFAKLRPTTYGILHGFLCGLLLVLTVGCPKKGPSPEAQVIVEDNVRQSAEVILVNSQYRFVVLNLRNRPKPPLGTRLSVYRDNKNVGQVRITKPTKAGYATADVLKGHLRVGDTVR